MVTIILPVSRDYYLKRIFAQLELLECDRSQTNLLVYVDGNLNLFEVARNLTVNSKFNQKLCVYRKKGTPNVGSVRRRRRRIAEIHNEVKVFIQNADYIFLTEDDTLLPTTALKKMMNHYLSQPHMGLVSGVQIGRWGYDHIGAWLFDDVYSPTKAISVPLEKEFLKVDATGLYCCLTQAKLYMQFEFEPFEDALGPDVAFGLWLRQQGYQNFIDYSIKCDHLTKRETIKFDRDIVQVKLEKQADKQWLLGEL